MKTCLPVVALMTCLYLPMLQDGATISGGQDECTGNAKTYDCLEEGEVEECDDVNVYEAVTEAEDQIYLAGSHKYCSVVNNNEDCDGGGTSFSLQACQ